MTPKRRSLIEADGRTVDALLDHGASTGHHLPHAIPPDRLEAARRLFDLLGQLPPTDPPAGLVERTLAFVRQNSTGVDGGSVAAFPDEGGCGGSHRRIR